MFFQFIITIVLVVVLFVLSFKIIRFLFKGQIKVNNEKINLLEKQIIQLTDDVKDKSKRVALKKKKELLIKKNNKLNKELK